MGDGSLSSGIAMEAINNCIRFNNTNINLIINDNNMSISKPIGNISNLLLKLNFKKNSIKTITFFKNIGFKYYGPIDGNNIKDLTYKLNIYKNIKGLKIIHV